MAVTSQTGLVLDAIEFGYSNSRLLRGTYLRVIPGSICGLIGRNGCGKSTLIKIAAGNIQPQNGIVIVNDERFVAPKRLQRYESISYLPQESMLPGRMQISTILRSFQQRGAHVPEDTLLSNIADKRVNRLSTGERRYLECNLVLSLNRKYILLDEPFTGLAPLMIERLSEKIRAAAAEGSGVLLSDHYQHYLLPIIDDGYLLKEGRCQQLNSKAPFSDQLARLG